MTLKNEAGEVLPLLQIEVSVQVVFRGYNPILICALYQERMDYSPVVPPM